MDDDTKDRLKPLPFTRTASAGKQPEKDALLPALGDTYKAMGTPDNGEISRLVIIMGKDGFKPGATAYHFFQYVHLDDGAFGFEADGQSFRFGFSSLQPKLVTIRGRDLLRIADYIALRRLPWIRVADRDFRSMDGLASDEPIITRIEVTDWERPED